MTSTSRLSRCADEGMAVGEDSARQWLANVSYYRLSAYWYPARECTFAGVEPMHIMESPRRRFRNWTVGPGPGAVTGAENG